MEKIIIQKQNAKRKNRRATVVVKPETYTPIETIVDMLLTEALKYVEIR